MPSSIGLPIAAKCCSSECSAVGMGLSEDQPVKQDQWLTGEVPDEVRGVSHMHKPVLMRECVFVCDC